MAHKPDILLIESSVQAIDEPRRQLLAKKYNLIQYDCDSVDDFIERMKPGGLYASIQAIVRLGWHKVGRFADLRPFATEVVAHFPPSLKIVSCSGHGYDAADTVAMAERGIWYCNTPNACTEAVANTATWLVLDTFRYLTYAQLSARNDWATSRELALLADDPCGKALGIVGLGNIGLEIAKRCEAAYGMRVHYHGPRRKLEAEKTLKSGATFHETLDEMIRVVDCIVLAAPYTKETHHMLSTPQFTLAKPSGLRVVNIARGKMIDEEALLEAMKKKQVVGVGLDVHDKEPGVNPKLRDNWMVTLLPHVGVCSHSAWSNFEKQCWDNLEAYFETGKPLTPVHEISRTG
ncbi:hypothetical protein M409DRAFT_67380 [Zasmidium cellare ATCC 36951]|uniref:D-isomer specific 2-hydroxyacid dehydrogenase NAD-binding domain-containing protein n=1 Tax=Zasmidium cellare ATCC 36951 TaxID=1080233 RepID=A0A6A6CI47_ZASCE|nr:uncharacterized protein M409DRAFT_67380 [Zasmidium cellare ATCC 36951]KAF2165086.1 hypothetical protein M409DRAFT_67380 [Zasmidium cellare ATCC 36951]